MPDLIIVSSKKETFSRIGGEPRSNSKIDWPECSACEEPMQFLAQFYLPDIAPELKMDKTLIIFQCANDPGGCDEWDANEGGNKAFLISGKAASPMEIPEDGITTLDTEPVSVTIEPHTFTGDEDEAYFAALQKKDVKVVGRAGGEPVWLQQDETPKCCGKRMRFALQIEEGASKDLNFGGHGMGYAFVCEKCAKSAKFLTQND